MAVLWVEVHIFAQANGTTVTECYRQIKLFLLIYSNSLSFCTENRIDHAVVVDVVMTPGKSAWTVSLSCRFR